MAGRRAAVSAVSRKMTAVAAYTHCRCTASMASPARAGPTTEPTWPTAWVAA